MRTMKDKLVKDLERWCDQEKGRVVIRLKGDTVLAINFENFINYQYSEEIMELYEAIEYEDTVISKTYVFRFKDILNYAYSCHDEIDVDMREIKEYARIVAKYKECGEDE